MLAIENTWSFIVTQNIFEKICILHLSMMMGVGSVKRSTLQELVPRVHLLSLIKFCFV